MVVAPASERAGVVLCLTVMSDPKKSLTVLLASPRGFCAGVDRAIQIVERAIERYGRPVYVRHEIVHNRYVVENLEAKGAIFVDELDEVPNDRPVVFSAHGVPKAVPNEAARRNLLYVDATCPLVSKVHREAERHHASGRGVILIGHAGHPEVIGTMGQLPSGAVFLVEDVAQAEALEVPDTRNLAYATQTTLSVDDTVDIVAVLRRRFPAIQGPKLEDICYATTNRQAAVKAIAGRCDALVVIGAPNSSNSMRLVEVAANYGCARSRLVQRAVDMDWAWLDAGRKTGTRRLGITAGASAPELLVDELIAACRARYDVTVEEVRTTEESVVFKLPRQLVA
jgi:4-hydroxy-3-methylbut-2-en-1-yl diphosphate reductase